MSTQERLRLVGATGSPYTRKMVALLRYRHIPYSITWADPAGALDAMGIEKPKPTFLPTFLFEDDNGDVQATCDSTPIIRRLEKLYAGRSVIPSDPALAFLDYLIEDFADEWCTKYMFHYRWYPAADADNAGTLLPLGMGVSLPSENHKSVKELFSKRQIDRLYVVGSNDTTAPVIDASYRRYLAALEAHLEQQPFMLGNRPGAGDFGMFGQLTQLVGFDPTPRAVAHEVSPRTVAWVDLMEDQCGLEPQDGDWTRLEDMPATLKGLLDEIGRVYTPALLANAKSVEAGEKTWEAEIDGAPWTQKTFPYQAKCLRWVNEQYRALSDSDKTRVNTVLAGTGCEALLSDR
ncbi:MAG: glutathione S-transferase N-terminal domain-containing protein [Halioglobus sp.]|nr:glutathione S-transferase N-terminal domain-containing protein [Halioglobus sp.]